METLRDYILTFAARGACTCGKCLDAPPNPEQAQPEGHTVDLTFFKVAAREGADGAALRAIVEQDYPALLDGVEHNYLEIGAKIGSQDMALTLIGLGHVLGIWRALSPDTLMPSMPDDLKKQMAGGGMVALNAKPADEVKADLAAALEA